MAQALYSALRTTPSGRQVTTLQAVFGPGTRPELPVEFHVTRMQDGKRFSTRQVRVVQSDRTCLIANVTCQVPQDGPAHQRSDHARVPDPENLIDLRELPEPFHRRVSRINYFPKHSHSLEARAVDPERDILEGVRPEDTFRLWLRARNGFSTEDRSQQFAVLTYLADYWTAYVAIGSHVPPEGERINTATLNHAMWFHAPYDPMEWLLVVSETPCVGGGRGLSWSRLYDRKGILIATVAQDVLVAPE